MYECTIHATGEFFCKPSQASVKERADVHQAMCNSLGMTVRTGLSFFFILCRHTVPLLEIFREQLPGSIFHAPPPTSPAHSTLRPSSRPLPVRPRSPRLLRLPPRLLEGAHWHVEESKEERRSTRCEIFLHVTVLHCCIMQALQS